METTKIIASIFAGVITVLTPCVLPFLPVILSSSLGEKRFLKPLLIIGSLSISVFLFGIVFNQSIEFIGLSREQITIFSGALIAVFGVFTLFPNVWQKITHTFGFDAGGKKLLSKGGEKWGIVGPILMGLALGPIFSGCSPTFGLILGILAESGNSPEGLAYLGFYVAGIAVFLLAIALLGQKLTKRIGWAVNPNGAFKKVLGVILILTGVAISFGIDKEIEKLIITNDLAIFTEIEQKIGDGFEGR